MLTVLSSPIRRTVGLCLLVSLALTGRATVSYPVVPAFGGLRFQEPIQIVFAPGETSRAFVAERAGRVALIRDLNNPTREVLLDLSSRVNLGSPDHGLLSIAFHPNFAQNGYLYLWTSVWENNARFLRLLRFTAGANTTIDPASELTLFSQPMGAGGHDGGTLLFGADGYLYLSIGDGDQGTIIPEVTESHQRIDRGFLGGVLRIDVDKRPGNLTPNPHLGQALTNYAIPADNPFVGATSFNGQAVDASSLRTEFWATGLRNPFRMAFDPATGQLWVADVGLNEAEEIDVVQKGQNFGWDFFEGNGPGPRASSRPTGVTFAAPVWQYDHSQGDACITGGILYRGAKFSALQTQYLFADFISGRMWSALPATIPIQTNQVTQIASEPGIVAITEQPGTGDVLLVNLNRGLIEKLGDASTTSFAPTISVQPVTQSVLPFSTVALRVEASGSPAPTYQWFLNGGAIAGATEATCVVHSANNFSGTPRYSVTVTNSAGSVTSATATLFFALPGNERRVINISTRGFVGTGGNILIAGFTIGQSQSKTVLIRAAGPALTPLGVEGVLADPQLTLFDGTKAIASNRGWNGATAIVDAAAGAGAFAWTNPQSKDSAILITLPPGGYTVQITGATGGTGVALVEVYDIP